MRVSPNRMTSAGTKCEEHPISKNKGTRGGEFVDNYEEVPSEGIAGTDSDNPSNEKVRQQEGEDGTVHLQTDPTGEKL